MLQNNIDEVLVHLRQTVLEISEMKVFCMIGTGESPSNF